MRYVFDTSVLIDYVRDYPEYAHLMAVEAISIACSIGTVYISLVSYIELYKPNSQRQLVTREMEKIKQLTLALNLHEIPCTVRVQEHAIRLANNYYSPLGKNAVPDSLIIATGKTRRATLVTKDFSAWKAIGDRERLRVLSPADLVREGY